MPLDQVDSVHFVVVDFGLVGVVDQNSEFVVDSDFERFGHFDVEYFVGIEYFVVDQIVDSVVGCLDFVEIAVAEADFGFEHYFAYSALEKTVECFVGVERQGVDPVGFAHFFANFGRVFVVDSVVAETEPVEPVVVEF